MALIDDATAAQLRSAFSRLGTPVRLVAFLPAAADPAAEEVSVLVEELALLDPRLEAERRRFGLDAERVAQLGIERVPAIAVLGGAKDHGIRFYGRPSGYEFGSLIATILDVSAGDSGLADDTRRALAALERDVHIRVFSTPT
jgi:alkyl hydroperoxide reductase subunit AhpF